MSKSLKRKVEEKKKRRRDRCKNVVKMKKEDICGMCVEGRIGKVYWVEEWRI